MTVRGFIDGREQAVTKCIELKLDSTLHTATNQET